MEDNQTNASMTNKLESIIYQCTKKGTNSNTILHTMFTFNSIASAYLTVLDISQQKYCAAVFNASMGLVNVAAPFIVEYTGKKIYRSAVEGGTK